MPDERRTYLVDFNTLLKGDEIAVFELRQRHNESTARCGHCGKDIDAAYVYVFLDSQQVICESCMLIIKKFALPRQIGLVVV